MLRTFCPSGVTFYRSSENIKKVGPGWRTQVFEASHPMCLLISLSELSGHHEVNSLHHQPLLPIFNLAGSQKQTVYCDELLSNYVSQESVTVAIKTNALFLKFFSSSGISP